MRRYGLHDDEWDRIKDLLPGRKGDPGATAKDNRLSLLQKGRTRDGRGCAIRSGRGRLGKTASILQLETRVLDRTWQAGSHRQRAPASRAIDDSSCARAQLISRINCSTVRITMPNIRWQNTLAAPRTRTELPPQLSLRLELTRSAELRWL
jgi:hypothetical protein